MKRVCYMVTATFPSPALADEYVAWLEGGHVDQVVNGGANAAMIVRLEPDGAGHPRVLTQYVFPTREVFDHYVIHHAPGLRAEGIRQFPPERGVRMERSIGTIV